jgi:hypothetical protein
LGRNATWLPFDSDEEIVDQSEQPEEGDGDVDGEVSSRADIDVQGWLRPRSRA